MKRFIYFLSFLTISIVAFAAEYVVTANSAVDIRTNPSENYGRVIGHLQPGDTIWGSPEMNNPEKWVMLLNEHSRSDFGYVSLDHLTMVEESMEAKSAKTLWNSNIPLYGFNSEWLHVKRNALMAIGLIFALWVAVITGYYIGKHKYYDKIQRTPARFVYTNVALFLLLCVAEIAYVCALGLDSMWILDKMWTTGGIVGVIKGVAGYCIVFVMLCFQYVSFKTLLADVMSLGSSTKVSLKFGQYALAICVLAIGITSWKFTEYIKWACIALVAGQLLQAAIYVVNIKPSLSSGILMAVVYLSGVTAMTLVLTNYYGFMFCVFVVYLVYLFVAYAPINTNRVAVIGSDGVLYMISETDIDDYNAGRPVKPIGSQYGDDYVKNKQIVRGINSPKISKPSALSRRHSD